jgi:general secretion pathway protein G
MRAKGFTLVEILIVVVILGILAAIVIPQFTDASTQARESSLCSDLQTLRSQIELYKIQHNDTLAGITTEATFVANMTGYTDIDGVLQSSSGPNVYGKYMQSIPKNPFNDLSAVEVTTDETATVGSGGTTYGWWLNAETGEIRANDDKTCNDANSTPHVEL